MLRKVFHYIFSLALALITTFILAHFLIPLAYMQRGYIAIGGEYLLLLFIFLSVFYFTATLKD